MKNFTKSGFLYYELSQLQGKPAIIIYSDKETESKIFANDAVRREYMTSLGNILKEAGVTLYQIPYSAVWINPLTLLSVRTVNSKLIVLEFPWGYSKQLKYPNVQLVKEVYDEIVKNLNPNGTADKYLTKEEAKDTYATQANVTNDLNKKADKANTLEGYGINDAYTKAEVNAKVSSVYKYKGSVANYKALPKEDNVVGDVYNVEDTGANYAWTGTDWDKLSETVDLTNYITNDKLTEELSKKADKAESLSGYGIADAYTIRQTDAKFDKKADKTEVVDLVSNQEIAGNKSFTGEVSINGTLNDANFGTVISANEGTLSLGDETKNIVLKAKDNAIVQKGSKNYVVLDSENYSEYVESAGIATTEKAGLVKPDGTTITITEDGTITSVGGGSVSGEKYGIRGDYSTRYGILECPDGILEISGMQVTLLPRVVMQLTGKEGKFTNASRLPHIITSTSDIDLFFAENELIECGDVFYQEEEPENGQANYVAWWNPVTNTWKFKSNDTGNVFREKSACRLAHIHTDGISITRVDYIGNRILDDEIFAEKKDLSAVAFSGSYNNLEDKPTIPEAYELPKASADTLGGIKVGSGLTINNEGVLRATGIAGTTDYTELTNKPTINNVELTGNKTSSDLNLTSNTDAVINNSLTLQEGDASLKVNFTETSGNKKVSEVQINGADYIDVLAQTHFLVAPTCGEQESYTDNEFMPKKAIIDIIHMYSPKVHTDVALTSSVKDDGDTTYPYLNTFNIADAEATDIPTVILSSDQVLSGNWSSISETIEGAVTIRTKVEITEDTTIPQIILQKATN